MTTNTALPRLVPANVKTYPYDHSKSISIILLVIVCASVLLYRLDTFPHLWFDEGYKLNAAYTIANEGLYATHTTEGYVPFDPGTSGGPADILPTAFLIKLFGANIFVARLTSVVYGIIAVISLYLLACYMWGEKAALFSVLSLIAMPPIRQVSLVLMSRQSLSEAAAFGLIVLGLWILSYSWRSQSFWWSLLSGVMMGLGILSKTQIAISLLPALFFTAAWRWLRERKGLRYLLTPIAATVGVFIIWMLIGQLFTPAAIRQQNSALLMDAIRTNLLTDLLGRNLDGQALIAIGIMLLGTVTGIWRLWRTRNIDHAQWLERLLVLFTLFTMIWFTFLSVGWVRYAFAGMVVGLFLVGRFLWDVLTGLFQKRGEIAIGLIGVMLIAALAVNLYTIYIGENSSDVLQTAQYITHNIPKTAVIETWEWELDMISAHTLMHHPPQKLLFESIREMAHARQFSLDYDALQANPDYLIIGKFGGWTNIYPDAMLQKYFEPVATFGMYHIFKRIRPAT